MPERRKTLDAISPAYEDQGVFPSPMLRMAVELTPQMSRNGRGDVLVRAFADNGTEIIVVFAGRRAKLFKPLEARLRQLVKDARKANSGEDPDDVRLPLRVEGAWRSKFARDEAGWETRQYHLMAAQWAIDTPFQPLRFTGEAPKTQHAAKRMGRA